MSQSPSTPTGTTTELQPSDPEASGRLSVEPDELFSMLGEENTRDVLRVVTDDSLPAREVANRLDISRSTAYRRLNRLEEAALVETTTACHPDGHHRKQFRAAVTAVRLTIRNGEFAIESPTATTDDRSDNAQSTV